MLTEHPNDTITHIQSYSDKGVTINNHLYTHSIMLSPATAPQHWPVSSVNTLTDADLTLLLKHHPEIILIGTGSNGIILPASTLRVLHEQQFQVECMNTPAACRTFTALAADGRHVVAGLIL